METRPSSPIEAESDLGNVDDFDPRESPSGCAEKQGQPNPNAKNASLPSDEIDPADDVLLWSSIRHPHASAGGVVSVNQPLHCHRSSFTHRTCGAAVMTGHHGCVSS